MARNATVVEFKVLLAKRIFVALNEIDEDVQNG